MLTFYKFIYNKIQAKYTKQSPSSLKDSLEALCKMYRMMLREDHIWFPLTAM